MPFSAALLVAWMPLGLRLTCYYYRKAYYRSFFLAPPACAVAGPRRQRYRGEATFPLVLQNVAPLLPLPARSSCSASSGTTRSAPSSSTDGAEFGVGLGSLVLLANVVLPDRVHVRLQLAPPPRRRPARLLHLLAPPRGRGTRLWRGVDRAEPPPHAVGVGQPRAASRSPTSTSGSRRAACSTIRGSSETWRRAHDYDVLVIGAGGAGLRAAIAASAARRADGARLQVAARQGAHGDGRGRRRGVARQRRRRRRLEDALPGHDVRRQVPEQLADGRAARARRRPTASSSSSTGAASSTGRPTGGCRSARSAATRYRRLVHIGDRTGLRADPHAAGQGACTAASTSSWSARSRGC